MQPEILQYLTRGHHALKQYGVRENEGGFRSLLIRASVQIFALRQSKMRKTHYHMNLLQIF